MAPGRGLSSAVIDLETNLSQNIYQDSVFLLVCLQGFMHETVFFFFIVFLLKSFQKYKVSIEVELQWMMALLTKAVMYSILRIS